MPNSQAAAQTQMRSVGAKSSVEVAMLGLDDQRGIGFLPPVAQHVVDRLIERDCRLPARCRFELGAVGPDHRFVGGPEQLRVDLGDNVGARRSLQYLREHCAHCISGGAAEIVGLAALTAVEKEDQGTVEVANVDDRSPGLEVANA